MRTHNDTDFVHKNPRPTLVVESKGGANLGRCYTASYYQVTSLSSLSMEDLVHLRSAGFLGYGQEFSAEQVIGEKKVPVPAKLDWQSRKDIQASGVEMIPCTMVDRRTGEVIPGEAINPYSGKPYGASEQSYYVYVCESRCDSSD
jgi:hypothetical protein